MASLATHYRENSLKPCPFLASNILLTNTIPICRAPLILN
jgi:hypothetical protein